jgi:hypothetical protein
MIVKTTFFLQRSVLGSGKLSIQAKIFQRKIKTSLNLFGNQRIGLLFGNEKTFLGFFHIFSKTICMSMVQVMLSCTDIVSVSILAFGAVNPMLPFHLLNFVSVLYTAIDVY